MIDWALRWVLAWCIAIVVGTAFVQRAGWLAPSREGSGIARRAASPADRQSAPASNTLVYPADHTGHVVIDVVVNGVPIRMLVDTGASLVTLTPEDARAAGIDPGELVFNRRASTANGIVRMAPVTLREIRLGQLSVSEVRAAVLDHLGVSLLGMSFLGRLESYEMRDGKLIISW